LRLKVLMLLAAGVVLTTASPAVSAKNQRIRVIVVLKQRATPAAIAALERSVGPVSVRARYSVIPAFSAAMTRSQARALARRPGVARVEPDRVVHALNDTSEASFGVTKARIDDPALDGAGLTAAVLDTGIDTAHVDLDGGKVVAFVDCTVAAACVAASPFDDNGHGTHVSATLAGDGDGTPDHRYQGVAAKAQLAGVKVLDSAGSGNESSVLAGLQWVVDNHVALGIRALSMSLGAGACGDGTSPISAAVNGAVAAGIVATIAAGNNGPAACTVASPGDAANAITVGAMADTGPSASGCSRSACRDGFREAYFSSRGPTFDGRIKPDVSAPGVAITSARAGTANGYVAESGTSMATPFVAGVALLMLDQNPGLTPAQVKSTIMSTAVDWGPAGADNTYGAGRLDAYAALRAAGAPIAAPPGVPGHASFQGSLPSPGDTVDVPLVVKTTAFPVAATLLVRLGQASLELLDPSGATIAESEFGEPGTDDGLQQEFGLVVPGPGNYTVRIRTVGGGGPFTLDLSGDISVGPRNVSAPAIAGMARHGSRLTAVSGGWLSAVPITEYDYTWLRCDSHGADCVSISGATASAYTAQRPDVGRTLRVAVTANSGVGSGTAESNAVAIRALRPTSRAAPTISGSPRVGRLLRARPGRWSGSTPFSYRYQWLRCAAKCRAIRGATHASYRVRKADLARRLRVRVRASNVRLPAGGTSARVSRATAPIRR
jgi:serine protease AprX